MQMKEKNLYDELNRAAKDEKRIIYAIYMQTIALLLDSNNKDKDNSSNIKIVWIMMTQKFR